VCFNGRWREEGVDAPKSKGMVAGDAGARLPQQRLGLGQPRREGVVVGHVYDRNWKVASSKRVFVHL
jgi:hypothetical protein